MLVRHPLIYEGKKIWWKFIQKEIEPNIKDKERMALTAIQFILIESFDIYLIFRENFIHTTLHLSTICFHEVTFKV